MAEAPVLQRARASVTGAVRQTLRPARLLIAAKCALAATLAWLLGRLIPGEIGEFAYYAPLGALIGVAPSLAASLRSSIETLIALALGIGVAWALIMSPAPPWVAVALAVGFGTILAGHGGLGAGREYVPIAAMFVLIVGGRNADGFSVGYLAQMGVGVVLGIAVNLLVVPPLRENAAAEAVSAQQRRLADVLRSMGEALDGDEVDWEAPLADAQRRTDEVAEAVRDARDTRRANPRARFSRYDVDQDVDDLRVLGRLARHLGGLGDVLRGGGDEPSLLTEASPEARARVAEVLRATAELLDAWSRSHTGGGRAGDPGRGRDELLDPIRDGLDALRPGEGGDPFEPLVATRYIVRSIVDDVDERMQEA